MAKEMTDAELIAHGEAVGKTIRDAGLAEAALKRMKGGAAKSKTAKRPAPKASDVYKRRSRKEGH